MLAFLYLPLILILYARQIKYHVLIDDPVKRDECPWKVNQGRYPPETYEKKKSLLAVTTNLCVFLSCCGYLHLLFGWPTALLFAVFPLNVSGCVWNTGNYYMSTVLLVLAATYQLLHNADYISIGIAAAFYSAALNSTPTALSFYPVALFISPWGWVLTWPLVCYLFGTRFKKSITGRHAVHANIRVAPKVTLETLQNVPKVIAYYIWLSLWPSRLAFFHSWGKDRKVYKHLAVLLISIFICEVWAILLFRINPIMCLWWFAAIGLWSQFIYLGQFIAERYTYLANVAWCVVLAKAFILYATTNVIVILGPDGMLHPYNGGPFILYWIIATLYFCKSWSYAKSYYHNERLFSDSIAAQPSAVENYNNLACCYLDKGRVVDAIRPLHAALFLSHGYTFGIHTNLANCYIVSGEYAKALYHTEEALKQSPDDERHKLINQKFTLVEKIRMIARNRKKLIKEGLIINLQDQQFIRPNGQ